MSIEEIVDQFNDAKTYEEESKLVPALIDYFETKGPSNFRLVFWKKTTLEKKDTFIRGLFNHLISLPSARKLDILKIIRNLFIDSEAQVKEKFLMIIYAALFEKKNYKIALSALDFFTQMYTFFTDEEKRDVFGKLLDFIQIADPDISDEGINAITNILQEFTKDQRKELFEVLTDLTKKKDLRIKYVSFENLEQLLHNYPIEFPTQEQSPFFKKVQEIAEKNVKLMDSKTILSLIRLYLLFEKIFDKSDEEYILKMLEICIKHLDEEFTRELVSVLILFCKSMKFTLYDSLSKQIIPFVVQLNKDKNNLNENLYETLEEFLELIWDNLSDADKAKFY
jgi:hypothetical protein